MKCGAGGCGLGKRFAISGAMLSMARPAAPQISHPKILSGAGRLQLCKGECRGHLQDSSFVMREVKIPLRSPQSAESADKCVLR